MNKKAVQWLYKELPALVSQGVLSQESADSLRRHFGDIKGIDKKALPIILCSVLGALLIGLGIILVFAHNWEELSRPVRLVLSLLPLLIAQGLALWVMLNRSKSQALKESTAIFLSLMVGASIALIHQTYHMPGDTPSFILMWMLLIVPLVYLMQSTISASIFIFGISIWVFYFLNEPLKAFLFWPLLAIVVPHFIWALRQATYTIRATILATVMMIGICIGAGITLSWTWPGLWVVVDSSLIVCLYLLGAWKFQGISTNWQKPLQILGGLGVFVMMYMLTFRTVWDAVAGDLFYQLHKISIWRVIPDSILSCLIIAGALWLFLQYVKRQDWMRIWFGALPLMALLGYVLSGISVIFPMLIFNIYLFTVSVFRLKLGIRTNSLRVVNTGMLMLVLLVLARFSDSGINFILRGLVFIVAGIGFLVVNTILLRRKGGAA